MMMMKERKAKQEGEKNAWEVKKIGRVELIDFFLS